MFRKMENSGLPYFSYNKIDLSNFKFDIKLTITGLKTSCIYIKLKNDSSKHNGVIK